MADQTDHFVREVQDEMRKERLARLWDKYGIIIVVAAVLCVVGVGAFQYIQHSNRVAREAAGAEFESATRLAAQGKAADAHKAFDTMIKSAPPGYGTLARLRNAGAFSAEGKRDEAVAAYDAVSKDTSADAMLRDYATLQAALLRLDSADWTEMQNRLKDLANDSNAWRVPAREVLGLAAMKAGNQDEARKAFEQILADTAAPPATTERARVLMTILTEAALAKQSAPAGGETKPAEVKPADTKPADAGAKK